VDEFEQRPIVRSKRHRTHLPYQEHSSWTLAFMAAPMPKLHARQVVAQLATETTVRTILAQAFDKV
tara:strand:- start:5279 stop:5476 length:198 start_codon:yes stop_codon:yes gene_type:complete